MSREYVCTRKCHFGKGETKDGKAPPRKIYCEGDREYFAEGERIPRHFSPVDELPPVTAVKDDGPVKLAGLRAPVDQEKLAAQKAEKPNGKKKKLENDF